MDHVPSQQLQPVPQLPNSNSRNRSNTVIKSIGLFLLFIVLAGMVFLGTQWFSQALEDVFLDKSISSLNFAGSLGDSISDVSASSLDVSDSKFLPYRDWETQDVLLPVQSALSLEIGGKQPKSLFEKNPNRRLPIASLTKLMTALVVFEHYDLSKKVTITQAAMDQEGEQGLLKLGQVFTVKDLLYVSLMESSNRAAYALSQVMGSSAFIAAMNDHAKDLNLQNTHFKDVTGLSADSYSTVNDMAILTQHLFKNYPLFREIVAQKEYPLYLPDGSFHHNLVNTNELLWQNEKVVGGKTGFTPAAQGCFMVIEQGKMPNTYFIHVIFGSSQRFDDMKKLIEWKDTAYQW